MALSAGGYRYPGEVVFISAQVVGGLILGDNPPALPVIWFSGRHSEGSRNG